MEKETKKVKTPELPEGVTQEEVTAWKNRYGDNKVHSAELYDDDGNFLKEVVIRTPGRKELGDFEKWVDRNPDKAKEITVNSCLLSHKEVVKENEKMFLSAFDAIVQKMPVCKAVVKNL